jgi:hypothetical protein
MNRKQSGVKHYKIFRQIDNPNYVVIELEFDNTSEAEAMLIRLQKLGNQLKER